MVLDVRITDKFPDNGVTVSAVRIFTPMGVTDDKIRNDYTADNDSDNCKKHLPSVVSRCSAVDFELLRYFRLSWLPGPCQFSLDLRKAFAAL